MIRNILEFLGILRPIPFIHNLEDFIISYETWEFYKENYYPIYSTNGGRNWKYIYHAKDPFLGSLNYDWEWEKIWYKVYTTPITKLKEKFPTYQSILDFENNEKKKFHEGDSNHRNQRRENSDRINKLYNE